MPDIVGPKTLVGGRGQIAGIRLDTSFRLAANSGQVSLQAPSGARVVGWVASPWLLDAEQFGGHVASDRTARRGTTDYVGVGSVSMSGTITLDGWGEGLSVAQQVRDLRAMASPSGPRELTPPQPVFVTGTVEVPNRWWVIARDGLTPRRENGSDVALRARDGAALRRAYDVVLLGGTVNPNDVVKGAVLLTNGKRYTSRAGDTPLRIASTQLGKASRWKELRDAKGKAFRDPKKRLKVGAIVRLP